MPARKYYASEQEIFKAEYAIKLEDFEAIYIFGKLKKRYKLWHKFFLYTNRQGGNCNKFRVRVSHNPSVGLLAHEVAHAIQFERRRHEKENEVKINVYNNAQQYIQEDKEEAVFRKWHTLEHRSIMRRVCKRILTKLERWKAVAKRKSKRLLSEQPSFIYRA